MVDSKSAMPGAALDPEEPILPPAGAPLVLHDPEVLPALRAKAHRSHRVVVSVLAVGVRRLLAAVRVVEDPVAVVEQVVSVDVSGGGSNGCNMGGHVSLARIPGDVVAGDAGGRVVAAVVVDA